jgi:hypothetical protein
MSNIDNDNAGIEIIAKALISTDKGNYLGPFIMA